MLFVSGRLRNTAAAQLAFRHLLLHVAAWEYVNRLLLLRLDQEVSINQRFPGQVVLSPVLPDQYHNAPHNECNEPSLCSIGQCHVQTAEQQCLKHVQPQLLAKEHSASKAIQEVMLQDCVACC